MSPATEALAFRIWAYASPRGWDVTAWDIAQALDESIQRVQYAITAKGWRERVRCARREKHTVRLGNIVPHSEIEIMIGKYKESEDVRNS